MIPVPDLCELCGLPLDDGSVYFMPYVNDAGEYVCRHCINAEGDEELQKAFFDEDEEWTTPSNRKQEDEHNQSDR